jgi:hypothetical protein
VKTHGGFHECKEILLKWKPNSSPTRTPIRLGIRSLFAVVAVLCLLFALYGRLKPSGNRALPEIVMPPHNVWVSKCKIFASVERIQSECGMSRVHRRLFLVNTFAIFQSSRPVPSSWLHYAAT